MLNVQKRGNIDRHAKLKANLKINSHKEKIFKKQLKVSRTSKTTKCKQNYDGKCSNRIMGQQISSIVNQKYGQSEEM